MDPASCTNTRHDITDFLDHEMVKNITQTFQYLENRT